jgi:hypothetical protein
MVAVGGIRNTAYLQRLRWDVGLGKQMSWNPTSLENARKAVLMRRIIP